jgi:hypothetical protein
MAWKRKYAFRIHRFFLFFLFFFFFFFFLFFLFFPFGIAGFGVGEVLFLADPQELGRRRFLWVLYLVRAPGPLMMYLRWLSTSPLASLPLVGTICFSHTTVFDFLFCLFVLLVLLVCLLLPSLVCDGSFSLRGRLAVFLINILQIVKQRYFFTAGSS